MNGTPKGSGGLLFSCLLLLAIGLAGSILNDGSFSSRGFFYESAKRMCEITNPAQTWRVLASQGNICERQHVVQQQSAYCRANGTECDLRTVYWATWRHNRTDRSRDASGSKPFERDQPYVFGITNDNNINLLAAYKMGTYGTQWHTLFVNYRNPRESRFIPLEFDGVSNIVYFWSWLVNAPQKFINELEYVIWSRNWWSLLDITSGMVFFIPDLILALLSTLVGVLLGTALNPIDTTLAIPSGIWLMLKATWMAGAELFYGIFHLVTMRYFGS
jgi:hypothetical protein